MVISKVCAGVVGLSGATGRSASTGTVAGSGAVGGIRVPNAGRGGNAGVDAIRVGGTDGLKNGGLAAPVPAPAGPTNGRAPRRANGDFASSVL